MFFHRGDSTGEGGSNIFWLGDCFFTEVLDALEDGGLIVSDGSNARREFRSSGKEWKYCPKYGYLREPENRYWSLKQVGGLGERYGPTLV